MASRRDYLRSLISDAMLPFTQQHLEDVVMEVLNERKVPTRTDFQELRDTVNSLRGQVSTASSTVRRLEKRVAALEEALEAQS
jgi:polyhydroxyalkanoate synthesis regulator phasin